MQRHWIKIKGYKSTIKSIALGFYGHMGVYLNNNDKCNGFPYLIIEKTNPAYDKIYSLLLASLVSGAEVHFGPVVGGKVNEYDTCIVDEVALGYWPEWSVQ